MATKKPYWDIKDASGQTIRTVGIWGLLWFLWGGRWDEYIHPFVIKWREQPNDT